MEQISSIQYISVVNQQLEQIKSVIDKVIKQNIEYEQRFKNVSHLSSFTNSTETNQTKENNQNNQSETTNEMKMEETNEINEINNSNELNESKEMKHENNENHTNIEKQQNQQNQESENKLNKLESKLDNIDELRRRNKISIELITNCIEHFDDVKEVLEEFLDTSQNDCREYNKMSNDIVKSIEEETKVEMEKEIMIYKQEIMKIEEKYTKLMEMKKYTLLDDFDDNKDYIEKWTKMKIGEKVFDSDVNKWTTENSEFGKLVFGKEHLVFVIEDSENNMFGCYIHSPINCYQYKVNGEWKGSNIEDKNAFVFSLNSNGRLSRAKKFGIIEEERIWAFQIYEENYGLLFSVGDGPDICVFKENMKDKSYCKQWSFDYEENDIVLVGKDGKENCFIPTRIRVFQMI